MMSFCSVLVHKKRLDLKTRKGEGPQPLTKPKSLYSIYVWGAGSSCQYTGLRHYKANRHFHDLDCSPYGGFLTLGAPYYGEKKGLAGYMTGTAFLETNSRITFFPSHHKPAET